MLHWLLTLQLLSSDGTGGPQLHLVTEHYPPLQIQHDNGALSGLRLEVVEAIAKHTGLSYTLSVYPWSRAYKTALVQPNTLIFTIVRTKERENRFIWVGPLGKMHISFFYQRQRSDIKLSSLKDAHQYRISIIRGDAIQDLLETKGFSSEKNFLLVTEFEQSLRALKFGYADLTLTNPWLFYYSAQQAGLDPELYQEQGPILEIPELYHYMAFNLQTSKAVIHAFITSFNTLKANGTLEAITDKWRQKLLPQQSPAEIK